SSPFPSIFEWYVPFCVPPPYRYAVNYFITSCTSLAERPCSKEKLSRISMTRSSLEHKKPGKEMLNFPPGWPQYHVG
ncbi:hypothetical protein, partial [Blautia hydrogenotrophica]|uniref:hypothetical protein n=1 Tax=Blautia hydrogenotrophica TaxID=53443 RepID=UPI002590C669